MVLMYEDISRYLLLVSGRHEGAGWSWGASNRVTGFVSYSYNTMHLTKATKVKYNNIAVALCCVP